MKRLLRAILWVLAVFTLAGCDYARMTTDAAYDTYETRLPVMPPGSVAFSGGAGALRLLGPEELQNPLAPTGAQVLAGRRIYGNFCIHCHGARGNGHATVGQSFAPLPTDLSSDRVLQQNDGQLFYKIAFGYKRHPALVHTVMEKEIWAVILFIRHLPQPPAD